MANGSVRRHGALVLVAAALLLAPGCAYVAVNPSLLGGRGPLGEIKVQPAEGWLVSNKILLVDISGPITSSEDSFFGRGESTIDVLRETLENAVKDRNIVAVVLRIDSPGGGVTASDICYNEIKRFKKKAAEGRGRPVPVIAAMMDTAASGGYYLAMAADEVWAHPTTLTGSIGVVATVPQISGLAQKLGVGVQVVKSGRLKDMGSMWHELTQEERDVFQGMIDSAYNRFVKVVAQNRPGLGEADVRRLADGRVYTADQAKEANLIDNVGYMDDILAAARKRAGVKDASVVTYARRYEEKPTVYSKQGLPAENTQVNLLNIDTGYLTRPSSPRLHYLWLP